MSASHTNVDGTRVVFVDNGDGTGTLTHYDAQGQVTDSDNLTGLPLPPAPTAEQVQAQRVREALSTLATLKSGVNTFQAQYAAAANNTAKQTVILAQYANLLAGLENVVDLLHGTIVAVVRET